MINLFDYKDSNGYNVMQAWADNMPMQSRDRGKLDNRIDILERAEPNLLPPGLLHNVRGYKHIMHLVAKGKPVTLCPMLCRGVVDFQSEFTFLFGATEKDRKYLPRNAPEIADKNRDDLRLHTQCRCKHERFNKRP
ncbi:MAG: hypothetical protein WC389_22415 [Lutibacter sp.]|jgi:hypothetical protein